MSERHVALFDLDYTLYKGSMHHVILDFPQYLFVNGMFSKEVLEKMTKDFKDYSNGILDRKIFAENELAYYYEGIQGQSVVETGKQAGNWLLDSKNTWFAYTHELVGLMRIANLELIVVSGSPIEPVKLLAKQLGIESVNATRGEIKNGVFTGKLEEELATAEAKKLFIDKKSFDAGRSFAFGDSEGDYPLLEAVDNQNAFFFRDEEDKKFYEPLVVRKWQVVPRDGSVIRMVKDRLRALNALHPPI